MSFNPPKTFSISFTSSKALVSVPPLYLGGQKIAKVSCHTHLGLTLTRTLNLGTHIAILSTKVSKRLGMLQSLKYSLSRSSLDYLGQEKMSWFWSLGGSILTLIKKNCGPQNITRHGLHLSIIDDKIITKTCSFSNLTSKIFLCLAWFATISGT